MLTKPDLIVDGPDPIDLHVGQRLRARRLMLGISQEKLGEVLGLTFQQIQKYERGANRISASRLYYISRALETDVMFFFQDVRNDDYHLPAPHTGTLTEDRNGYESDPMKRDETLRLVNAYYRHSDPETRLTFINLLEQTARFPYRRETEEAAS